ncbi:unnamed protein product [Rangifer tarandus platyrhynchus]|uniref:Uncharacterized protein n=1 Tax=Rangifer tarandus platyrhynchus TaxID=3082113 RepID=A0AC59YG29_RANTA
MGSALTSNASGHLTRGPRRPQTQKGQRRPHLTHHRYWEKPGLVTGQGRRLGQCNTLSRRKAFTVRNLSRNFYAPRTPPCSARAPAAPPERSGEAQPLQSIEASVNQRVSSARQRWPVPPKSGGFGGPLGFRGFWWFLVSREILQGTCVEFRRAA